MARISRIIYVTSSPFKKEEAGIILERAVLRDGTPVKDVVEFEFRSVAIPETLEVDIEKMVRAEVLEAYGKIRKPCIVEHAGLIFDDFKDKSYPGGLTKPMWDTLKDQFIEETHSGGRKATARAVVAYCDGMSIHTFIGETAGRIADKPLGGREFYWDVVFIPDDETGVSVGRTYAEISSDGPSGTVEKVMNWSQSRKAMLSFFEHLRVSPKNMLWG